MTASDIKAKLLKGKVSIGAWMQIPSTEIAQVLAGTRLFDWIVLDVQHGSFGLHQIGDICHVIAKECCVPLIRGEWTAGRMLDLGAQGVIVPDVDDGMIAECWREECMYPPEGVRSFGFCRANSWGMTFDDYVKTANQGTLLGCQIEHKRAFGEDGDLSGIIGQADVTMIGPYDLSGSLGKPGKLDHPDVKRLVGEYLGVCKEMGKPAGTHVVRPDPDALREAIDDGYRFIAYGTDALLLKAGTAGLAEVKDDLCNGTI